MSESLDALRQALTASQRALEILEAAGDHEGSLKAARAVADIAQKIAKVDPGVPEESVTRKRLRAEIDTLLAEAEEEDREYEAWKKDKNWQEGKAQYLSSSIDLE